MAVPINVEFSDDVYAVLQQLAQRKGRTTGEMLRDIIALAKWLEDTRAAGGRILVERGMGNIKEIIPLP